MTALFAGLVDYAGVFPPAAHPVPHAVARYRAAREGPHGWMLGPFLCRSSHLGALADLPSVGVVVDGPLPDGHRPLRQVETTASPDDVARIATALAPHAETVFVESEHGDPVGLVPAVDHARSATPRLGAKIRTGGPHLDSFPDVETVAAFIVECVRRSLPFKATAGLHHPIRTPSGVVDGATEHGFLNLLAAVRIALSGGTTVAACLAEEDPSAFDPTTATWKEMGQAVPAHAVRSVFTGFGSCSFDEPVGHLMAMGALPSPEHTA